MQQKKKKSWLTWKWLVRLEAIKRSVLCRNWSECSECVKFDFISAHTPFRSQKSNTKWNNKIQKQSSLISILRYFWIISNNWVNCDLMCGVMLWDIFHSIQFVSLWLADVRKSTFMWYKWLKTHSEIINSMLPIQVEEIWWKTFPKSGFDGEIFIFFLF